jgi:hypothetical protein
VLGIFGAVVFRVAVIRGGANGGLGAVVRRLAVLRTGLAFAFGFLAMTKTPVVKTSMSSNLLRPSECSIYQIGRAGSRVQK